MIASPIPDQGNATVRTLLEEIFEKGYRAVGIAMLEGLNQTLLIVEVECSIVSLLIAFVENRHFNAL